MLRTHGRILEVHGLTPVLMQDPLEALEEIKQRLPGAIILDLMMPGMNGLELITRVRTYYGPRSRPPAILISGDHAALSPMEELMFDAIFPKPYSIDRMVYWVKRLSSEYWKRRHAPSDMRIRTDVLHLDVEDDEGER